MQDYNTNGWENGVNNIKSTSKYKKSPEFKAQKASPHWNENKWLNSVDVNRKRKTRGGCSKKHDVGKRRRPAGWGSKVIVLVGRREFRAAASPLREGDVWGAYPKLLHSDKGTDRRDSETRHCRQLVIQHSQYYYGHSARSLILLGTVDSQTVFKK